MDDGYYNDIASDTQLARCNHRVREYFSSIAVHIFFLSSSVKYFLVIHQNPRGPVTRHQGPGCISDLSSDL